MKDMKWIFTIILMLFAAMAFTQSVQVNQKDSTVFKPSSKPSTTVRVIGSIMPDSLQMPTFDTAGIHPRIIGSTTFLNGIQYTWDGSTWVAGGSGGGSSAIITAGVITTNKSAVGNNPGSNISVAEWIENTFYGLQPPTAALSPSSSVEFSSAPTSVTLNWSGGRGSNTPPLATIVITGNSQTYNQTFSQPSLNSSVSGTQAVNVPSDVLGSSTTFTNTVTTTGSVVATATATVTALGKWYYGFVDDVITSPSSAQIIALTGTLTASLSAIKAQTLAGVTVSNSTASRFVVAVPEALDASSTLQIWIGGLNSTGAFTESTTSVTNASGGVQNYHVYVQNTITSAGVSFQIK